MDFDLIEKQLTLIHPKIKRMLFSMETSEKIAKIGEQNGLLLDKVEDLIEEVGLTVIGLRKPSEFVANISNKLSIKKEVAENIANEINKEVLDGIKNEMVSIQNGESQDTSETPKTQTDLERVGGFSIEPSLAANSNGSIPANLPGAEEVTESREDLISGIENPPPAQPRGASLEENHTDIIVDNLLAGPVTAVEKKSEKPAEPPAVDPSTSIPTSQTTNKPSGHDLYREPIE